MTRHIGVGWALTDLGDRMRLWDDTDDAPHVAFVLTASAAGPTLHVAQSDGLAHLITEFGRSTEDEDEESEAPWSWKDLAEAQEWLNDVSLMVKIGQTIEYAIQYAADQRERRRDWEFTRALIASAHETEHPEQCSCGRRFKTARGLAQHQRMCHTAKADRA